MPGTLHLISIGLEVVIVVVCLQMAVRKRKWYGYGLALTYGIYVIYDLAQRFDLHLTAEVLQTLFFIATVSALLCIMHLYYRNG